MVFLGLPDCCGGGYPIYALHSDWNIIAFKYDFCDVCINIAACIVVMAYFYPV